MSVALEDMSPYARSLAERLGLEPHPEGGWYARDWQSPHTHDANGRPLASLIYFLLAQGDASAWHKVDADEIWLWHGPAPVTLELGGDGDQPETDPGRRTVITLGAGLHIGSAGSGRHGNGHSGDSVPTGDMTGDATGTSEAPVGHAVVPAGIWQRTVPGNGDALVSCVVSPGFVFEGFTLE